MCHKFNGKQSENNTPSKFFLQLFCSIALFDKARLPPKKISMLQPVLPRAHCTFCCALRGNARVREILRVRTMEVGAEKTKKERGRDGRAREKLAKKSCGSPKS